MPRAFCAWGDLAVGGKSLVLEQVSKTYGPVTALVDVTTNLNNGEVLGLIGSNGAGKSTLLRILTGQISPTRGYVEVLGRPVRGEALEVKADLGVVPDEDTLLGKVTPLEFLHFVGSVRRVRHLSLRIAEVLEFFEMTNWSAHLIETFSRGMKKRIQLAAAILHGPRLVVMDEPMSGFDPEMMAVIRSLITALTAAGTTVIMSTHDLPTAAEMCTSFMVLERGKVLAQGTAAELQRVTNTHSLTEAYLRLVKAPAREEEARALVARLGLGPT